MIYLITLLISVVFWIGTLWMQNFHGMGVGWRIAVLTALLFKGFMFIFAGVMAPPEPRGILLQLGAAFLTTIPICVAYVVYKNRRGW